MAGLCLTVIINFIVATALLPNFDNDVYMG